MQNLYVAPTGSDKNVGSKTSPLQTLERGAALAGPGDTVILENGIYSIGTNGYGALLETSGVDGSPITFMAANQGGAIIDGSNFEGLAAFSFAKNAMGFINIGGFEIRNFLNGGISMNTGSNGIPDGEHDILIAYNHIHNIGNVKTGTDYGIVGVGGAQGTRRVTIAYNQIDHIGRLVGEGPHGSSDHGLYLGGGDYLVIGNTFHDNDQGWDIQLAGHAGDLDAGYTIMSNIFGLHQNVGGSLNPGNIVIWNNTGKSPSGSLLNNTFAPTIGSPLHAYPATVTPGCIWTIQGNTGFTNPVTDAVGLTVIP